MSSALHQVLLCLCCYKLHEQSHHERLWASASAATCWGTHTIPIQVMSLRAPRPTTTPFHEFIAQPISRLFIGERDYSVMYFLSEKTWHRHKNNTPEKTRNQTLTLTLTWSRWCHRAPPRRGQGRAPAAPRTKSWPEGPSTPGSPGCPRARCPTPRPPLYPRLPPTP